MPFPRVNGFGCYRHADCLASIEEARSLNSSAGIVSADVECSAGMLAG